MFKKKYNLSLNFRRKVRRPGNPTPPKIKFAVVPWNSPAYIAAIDLRNESLNIPSNLPLLLDAPTNEAMAVHLVATIGREVVGTLYLDVTERDGVTQIKQVAVSSHYRGQRIGQQLMQYAELIATSEGYHEIVLNARDTAWNFYEKLDYQAFGEIYSNGSNDMQPYRKVLTPQPAAPISGVA